jgi:TolB-like protein/Tfp pilus assembly protein PilF
MDAILNRAPQPPSGLNRRVSPGLEGIILKALEKEPENRYQSAKELAVDLRRLGTPGSAAAVLSARRPATRRRMVWAAGVALVALLAVLVGLNVAGLRDRLLGGVAPGQITSIAVLPLENLMGDSEQDYFVDGMHDELIANLAKIGALTVISRTSVMQYKETRKPLPEIARELGVDTIIEGTVRRAGNQVRITVQLIEAATDKHLWAESYQRELRDVLALQSEVAQAIANEIRVTLTPEEQARLASARPVNPEAYEAYLKGRFHWYKITTPQDMETALEYFKLALEKDPDYALAYVGIGYVWGGRIALGVVPPREAWPKAKAAALKAMELDETLAEAHDILATVLTWFEWDWPGAEAEFQRAIELNPNYANARVFYSIFLTSIGRPQEGRAQIERALELDPLNSFFRGVYGVELMFMRQYDDAIAQVRKAHGTEPHPHVYALWVAFHQKRMYEEAVAEAKKYFAVLGHSEVAEALARGYAQGGYAGAMRRAAETLAARPKLSYVLPTQVAALYAHAGEKERALDWLEKAYQERDMYMVYLSVDPTWDSLRDDPRFQSLLRRMNFPE